MAKQIFLNNANAVLLENETADAGYIAVVDFKNFPEFNSMEYGDYFLLTLMDSSDYRDDPPEVVKVVGMQEIGVSGKTGIRLEVERGYENAAISHREGSIVQSNLTAKSMANIKAEAIEEAAADTESAVGGVSGVGVGQALLVTKKAGLGDKLRLDGTVHSIADYPELSSLLPEFVEMFSNSVSDTPELPDTGNIAAFSPDGTRLAVTHRDAPYLTVIDTSDWSVVSDTPTIESEGFALAYSPDGAYLAVASNYYSGTSHFNVFNTSDWSVAADITDDISSGWSMSFSPDGAYLAIGHSGEPYLTVIDTSDWSVISSTPTLPGVGNDVGFSPNGAYLAVGHDDAPYLTVIDTSDWSVVSGTPTVETSIDGLAYSPDGAYLATVNYYYSGTSHFNVFNTSDWSVVSGTPTLPGGGEHVTFSHDGAYLVVGHDKEPFLTAIDTSDWSLVLNASYGSLRPNTTLLPGAAYGMDFTPDDDYLAVPHPGSPYLTVIDVSKVSETEFKVPTIDSPNDLFEWRIKAK